jgi:hypothetical protein
MKMKIQYVQCDEQGFIRMKSSFTFVKMEESGKGKQ